MADPDQREQESRENSEDKFQHAVEREREEREEIATRLADEPLESDGDESS